MAANQAHGLPTRLHEGIVVAAEGDCCSGLLARPANGCGGN